MSQLGCRNACCVHMERGPRLTCAAMYSVACRCCSLFTALDISRSVLARSMSSAETWRAKNGPNHETRFDPIGNACHPLTNWSL